ncbi:hypothetical protein DWV29_20300 [Enterocloster asparagiformis]|uniref:Phospholipid/glycerol acyltransferase domain-containing protein n=3 Tax=Enterocloster asparagiformis TaxID=333367 RepID=A0A413FAZ0_9FIRM|nr:cytosine permease [Enterocloster asparagiformis]RGX26053.1 hypothetical protein DWV29_20300 [Enterocloster asparagiformis]
MKRVEEQIAREAVFGILPVLPGERRYGFLDAFLVLSGYCIATWSYTQGAYLAGLVGFKQLLIGAFFGAVLMLAVYQLPVILSVRYGIDIWIWLRSVFGLRGVKWISVLIIAINFPWYAVCCDLFASSMENLAGVYGLALPPGSHLLLELACLLAGTFIACRGIGTITWTTRILVPALLAVGAIVMVIGFRSVPPEVIWNYTPEPGAYADRAVPYIMSIEANFAFVITLVGGMAGVPRLARTERGGYLAGVLGQGLSGSFFVVVGAVMAIAMRHVTGTMSEDPTRMLAVLAGPALALCSLLLVAFANIGTQAVGSYIYGVMLKSSFPETDYRRLIGILAFYVGALCVWGKIVEYFGAFLTISACVYAPLAALLFVDFFFVRQQRLAFRSAYGLKGHEAYVYTRGFNLVGLAALAAGTAFSLMIYNPVTGVIHNRLLFTLTPTGCSFLASGCIYWLLCNLPGIRRYVRRDLAEAPDTRPFDRFREPPRQNLAAMPFIWLWCCLVTARAGLKIRKKGMKGLKPPFLVLATHHSFTDFYVTPRVLFPHRANYVSELEGFENFGEWLYRQSGCLGTRKFVDDLALVKNICRVLGRGGILVLYPEARYANVGTSSRLPLAVAKLVKLCKVPVVTLNMKGNYLQSPIWNLRIRREARLEAEAELAYTAEEVERAQVEDIYQTLSRLLTYDEYAWQRTTGLRITDSFRAEGLHLPLYQCRACGAVYRMASKGSELFCAACGARWRMDEFGTLRRTDPASPAVSGRCAPGPEIYIPDWYEWQRENVRRRIAAGRYFLELWVRVEALPNAVNFIDCGAGRLEHGPEGFDLTFVDYEDGREKTLHVSSASMSSIHTEYDYRGKGQCVTLSVPDNTYFLFPLEEGFNATEIQFAVEEFFERSHS